MSSDRECLETQARELYFAALDTRAGFDSEERASKLGNALLLFRELGDLHGQARALTKLGNVALNAADYAAALDYLHEAEDIAAELNDPAASREVRGQLCGLHADLGEHETALTYASRAWELDSGSPDSQVRMHALNGLGCILAAMGRHEEGVAKIEEAMALAEDVPGARRQHNVSQSRADLADAFLRWNRPTEALRHAEAGARIAREIGHAPLVMLNTLYAGRAASALNEWPLAEQRLDFAAALAQQMAQKSHECQARLELAAALAAMGRHEEALDSYRQGHRVEREIRKDEAARRLEFRRAKGEIDRARRDKESAERVLFAVLPQAIAQRIKAGEARIAEDVADVSVLFADLVGFTAMSTRAPPRELLALLERVFCEFDQLVAAFQLEKIKTIGDAYMAVGGALAPSPDHLERSAHLAIEMLGAVRRMGAGMQPQLAIRIGLHAGPAIAGVIGAQRLSYDLWGETVNLASRLESSGVPGRIHVSASAAERLRGAFALEPRGLIELKGFGRIPTFFLT